VNEDEEWIAETIRRLGNIAALGAEEDAYDAGLSSMQALELLGELEDKFAVTLPDEAFVRARTVRALAALIASQREAS
jgi:acyl carrier protein